MAINQYVRDKNGPNDHNKGNRTRGKDRRGNLKGNTTNRRDMSGLLASNASKAEMREHYRQIAEQQAKVTRYGQEYAGTLWDKLSEYITDRETQRRPITSAALVRVSRMSSETYYRYRNGDYDRWSRACGDMPALLSARESNRWNDGWHSYEI